MMTNKEASWLSFLVAYRMSSNKKDFKKVMKHKDCKWDSPSDELKRLCKLILEQEPDEWTDGTLVEARTWGRGDEEEKT
jgi:hypothetical protein